MTKRTRRKLFYALVAVFIVLGTFVVFYAEGWRIDFSDWHFEKVGEIYVRSWPEGANIALGKKSVKNESGFLTPGTLIPDLLPGNYTLNLSAPGYAPWHEEAIVAPSYVAQFKYAVLVPENATTTVAGPITDIALAQNAVVAQTVSNTILANGIPVADGEILQTDPRESNIVFRNLTAGAFSLFDLSLGTSTDLSALFLQSNVNLSVATNIADDPYETNLVAATDASQISILDVDADTMALFERAPVDLSIASSVAFTPDGIAWSESSAKNNSSLINFYSPSLGQNIVGSSTVPGKTVSMQWLGGSAIGVLQDNGVLYRYDLRSQIFTATADAVTSFAVSSDGTMLAAMEKNGCEIFGLASGDYYRFNLPAAGSIVRAVWYQDDNHLFRRLSGPYFFPRSRRRLARELSNGGDRGKRNVARLRSIRKRTLLYRPEQKSGTAEFSKLSE